MEPAVICLSALAFLAPIHADLGHAGTARPAATPPATCTAVLPDEPVLKALRAWLKAYAAGRIDVSSRRDVMKTSIADKHGVLPKGLLGTLTAERELELMLERAVELQSEAAAEIVLEVAAIGLDQGRIKYTIEMAPFAVRDAGQKALAGFESAEATGYLAKVARGEVRTDRTYGQGQRAAALRWLGGSGDPTARATLEQQLGSTELPLRLAAAEGLKQIADERSTDALAALLDRETEGAVIGAAVAALRACLGRHIAGAAPAAAAPAAPPAEPTAPTADPPAEPPAGDPPAAPATADAPAGPPPAAGLAVRAAIRALGRSSWQADMELIRFLGEFRSAETIPALIDVLQRFVDHPEEIESGKLSGLLLHRAHETLVRLTGAVFPADRPQQWRELWEQEKERMLIDASTPRAAKAAEAGTVSGGFCGIPVEGTRVLFIIDLSGSMAFSMGVDPDEPNKLLTRLDYAKQQLRQVIDMLPAVSRLNFITYDGKPDAEVWHKELVPANDRNKDRARKFVEAMKADGGTNMWAGLEAGLKMKSLIYGDRYESAVDEIFVVSDGAPSVGDIIDPLEILRLVTETNRFSKVRINTIYITSPNERNPRDQSLAPNELMRRLAEQNGGRFQQITR